ncbi:hypothetical protein Tco_0845928 [Tanacetum coccineum]
MVLQSPRQCLANSKGTAVMSAGVEIKYQDCLLATERVNILPEVVGPKDGAMSMYGMHLSLYPTHEHDPTIHDDPCCGMDPTVLDGPLVDIMWRRQ